MAHSQRHGGRPTAALNYYFIYTHPDSGSQFCLPGYSGLKEIHPQKLLLLHKYRFLGAFFSYFFPGKSISKRNFTVPPKLSFQNGGYQ
jgi:hypothetical protein